MMDVLLGFCKTRLSNVFLPGLISLRYKLQPKRRLRCVKHRRGLPPYMAKTIEQKLEGAAYKDPAVYYKVNIGLPQILVDRSNTLHERECLKKIKTDLDLEKKARENKISVSLDEVKKEWNQESGPDHIKRAAEHYGVFQDLFGDAFFYPQVIFDVAFKHEESFVPVCRGNHVKPYQSLSEPLITFDSDSESLWTLVATNPDGHLEQQGAECLHWFLGNIPGSNIKQGEQIAEYIQPFPPRGTGFQRFVFILYKQNEKLNYSHLQIPSKGANLKNRTFSTYQFYRTYQDHLTPAGLSFCLVDWDLSVSRFFHTVLDMEEPIYEYDFEPAYHPKQITHPIRQPFNLYMDRYRDPKQIAKEYLLRKLKHRHPFEAPKPPLRFPNAVGVYHDLDERLFGKIPSWLKREKLKSRLGHGRINDY